MTPKLMLKPVDDVPADSRVCHYDELEEGAKEEFPTLTESTGASVDCSVADGLQGCDLVKYTNYYEVSVS
ncbi:hypothetical protein [Natronosalvus rutilus]|uniref:DUF7979 domain-containing protein n=1 Tax=Natronosalvus rutilus TaxID=2953753 RepID=A0A9E7NEQ4_9EURY|nr:hypothetical protein [Natronosalvus rutilus]UTF55624.1 hypothetical protein NGM29_19690 [Natronosalvus rutilus]